MFAAIPASELAMLAGALLVGGLVSGFLAGLLGVGGGAVLVPVLYQLFTVMDVPDDIRMQLCVGTSLAVIIPTAIRSMMAHRRRGAVDMGVLRIWIVPVAVGTVLGALLAGLLDSEALELVFGLFGAFVGLQMLFVARERMKVTDHLPAAPGMAGYGVLIGLLSSLVGIGGGSLVNIVFALHGRSVHQGVATGAGVGLLISVPGAIGFMVAGWPDMGRLPPLSLGYVSVIGALLLVPTAMLSAPLGVRIAHGISGRKLEMALGFFLLIMGGRFLVELLVKAVL